MKKNVISVKGARENNLKNIDIDIPKDSLVVITGPSGSGKSTLAFDTIFAEGKRRYVESLSSYARQFLGGSEKPDVDSIDGLAPAISIDQRTGSNNPRSTVGTITEIHDYLRLLYARIGVPICPVHKTVIKSQSPQSISEKVLTEYNSKRVQILSPVINKEKGTHVKMLDYLLKEGFSRVYINGELYNLLDEIENIKLEKNKKHTINVVVDRIVPTEDDSSRVLSAVETALEMGHGNMLIDNDGQLVSFSQNYACPDCGFSVPDLEPRLFSFNNPIGACNKCGGLGSLKEPDINIIIPDMSLSLSEGAIQISGFSTDTYYYQQLSSACGHYGINLDIPVSELNEREIDIIMNGADDYIPLNYVSSTMNFSKDFLWEGVGGNVRRRYLETSSDRQRKSLDALMTNSKCSMCQGTRLSKEVLAIRIGGLNIHELGEMPIRDAAVFLDQLVLSENDMLIGKMVFDEVKARYHFLINVGLDYLNLTRSATTLSGGEAQRIRLATQIGSKLTGVLYVLDEPSIGLHQRDNDRLINTLKGMRDLGNSMIVVEHDEDTMLEADYIIDIGPGSGSYGGNIVAHGTPSQIMKNKKSLTGAYLSGREKIEVPSIRRTQDQGFISIINASENNLKNVTIDIPKNNMVCVTGVSGSGKSTLINQVLFKNMYNHFNRDIHIKAGSVEKIEGIDSFKKVIDIDQKPIGRTPRSNPATYVGVFDDIRDLFAELPESKLRGYQKGRFSFNVRGGRCDECDGDGIIKIEMNFLPDVYVTCEKCRGRRYNDDVLQIKYKGKNISDVLNMEISDAYEFFENIPKIKKKLATLVEVGLGYLTLGTPATVLSGGEAQRIKISKELQKITKGETLYILDEPTTGLHSVDIKNLIKVLQRLVDNGNSMIIIEHNLDLIKVCDYIIDIGPEGGDKGGNIIGACSPEELVENKGSYTGMYLKKYLDKGEV
jgi:excinuclease ABC subunit A